MLRPMTPLRLVETEPGSFSLLLEAGTAPVDDVVVQLGHEPSGYFWEGVARYLVSTEAEGLDGRFFSTRKPVCSAPTAPTERPSRNSDPS